MNWKGLLSFRRQPNPTTSISNKAVSVDIVYAQMIRSFDAQHEHARAIDTKAGFVLTAASVVIGFQGLPGASANLSIENPLWLTPAFVIYLGLLLSIFQAYRLRDFKSTGFDPAILQDYLFDETEFTKRQFIATMRLAYEQNIPQIDGKVAWLQRAEWLLLGEVGALLLGGLLSHEWSRVGSWLSTAWRWST